MKKILAAAIGAGALVVLGGVAPANAADAPAKLSVLHGVPGLTVDVYVNNELKLDDFKPGDLAGPLELPAGTYTVAITASDAADASAPAIGPVDLPLESGRDYTAVAHLTEAGEPALTPFVNDTTGVPAGEARVTVRHVAAAPGVDVRAGGQVVVDGLTNPNEESLTVPAGTVSADVVLAGTDTVAIGPADLMLAEGATTVVYAWGSQEAGYELAVQTISGAHSAPSGVPGGSAGLVDEGGLPLPVAAVSLAGLVAAGVAVRRLAGSRA